MKKIEYKRMNKKLAERIELLIDEALMNLGTAGYYDHETDEIVMAHEFDERYGWNVEAVYDYIVKTLKLNDYRYR